MICDKCNKELERNLSKPHYPAYICPQCKSEYVKMPDGKLVTEEQFKETRKEYNGV